MPPTPIPHSTILMVPLRLLTALLLSLLVSTSATQSLGCSGDTFGPHCEYVVDNNCVVGAVNPSDIQFCVAFEYFDCEDKLMMEATRAFSSLGGADEDIYPLGEPYPIYMPYWKDQLSCQDDALLGICGQDETCTSNCFVLSSVDVNLGEDINSMDVCGHFVDTEAYPVEFCQTVWYYPCGSENYLYPTCEHENVTSPIQWDANFLNSLDMSSIATSSYIPYSRYLRDGNLCVYLLDNITSISYPLECVTFFTATCSNSYSNILVASGYTEFTTEIIEAGNYCFGNHPNEYFCVNIEKYQYDHSLHELIIQADISFTNAVVDENNSFDVIFSEISLHFPSCGRSTCRPGNHNAINWDIYLNPSDYYVDPSYANMVGENTSDGDMESSSEPNKKHSNNSNATLIWSLVLSISATIVIVLIVVLLFAGGLFKRHQVLKKRGLLQEDNDEDIEIEMQSFQVRKSNLIETENEYEDEDDASLSFDSDEMEDDFDI